MKNISRESILKELGINENRKLERQYIDKLIETRKKICKFIKIDEFSYDALKEYENNILNDIEVKNEEIKINNHKKSQLDKVISDNKKLVSDLKSPIGDLENKIEEKSIECKKLNKLLRMLLSNKSRNKFKRRFIPKYIILYKKYGDIREIEEKINNCNIEREVLRKEKECLLNKKYSLEKKINNKKKLIGRLNKNSIHKEKEIEKLNSRLEVLNRYLEIEKNIIKKILNV